jgi:hypothetical protein
VLHDGNGNGRLDFDPANPQCLDLDGDGALERTEDFPLRASVAFSPACEMKLYRSPEVTQALSDRNVFSLGWPAWIATPSESRAFWALRDATLHWDGLAASFPDLAGITVFSAQDHVQSQPDHPHLRQAMDGFTSRGLWFRLQADAAYYEAVAGSLPVGYVENRAGEPVPPGEMKLRAEPQGTAADTMGAAAMAEVADRVHSGCWWPDLSSTMRPPAVAADAGMLRMGADRRTISWVATPGAFCYDVLRGDLAALADDGAQVPLQGAVCVEDDSPDTAAADPSLPGPGQVLYYLVKPNGLHGRYGAASNGHAREDAGRGCGR